MYIREISEEGTGLVAVTTRWPSWTMKNCIPGVWKGLCSFCFETIFFSFFLYCHKFLFLFLCFFFEKVIFFWRVSTPLDPPFLFEEEDALEGTKESENQHIGEGE